jgi:hypothetical protein
VRFEALTGPSDSDWSDVRRRVRRRTRKVVVAAAALLVALGAAGLAIGGEVIGVFAEHGKRVPLSSFPQRDRELLVGSLCRRLAFSHARGRSPEVLCRNGAPTIEEIANDGTQIHWRVRYPWGLTCVASGPVKPRPNPAFGDSQIATLGCDSGAGKRKLIPTPARPITVDASMGGSAKRPHIRLVRLEGLAGRGVATVGLVTSTGATLTTHVRGNAYAFRTIPDRRWVAVVAYDKKGTEVYREPLQGVGTPIPRAIRHVGRVRVYRPKVPVRPDQAAIQHAITPTVTADVYRGGVVLMRFASIASEPYRHLARSARHTHGVVGIGCRTVAFGAGRWKNLGGGTNARVAPTMGMRLVNRLGGMPSPPFDTCEVSGMYGRYWNDEQGTHELVEVPFTPLGQRYLVERGVARDLAYFVRTKRMHRIRLAIHRGEAGPSAASLARQFGERVVAVPNGDATAPLGKIGVWTDGKLIVASELTPGGRRLYVTLRDVFIGPNNIRDLSFTF